MPMMPCLPALPMPAKIILALLALITQQAGELDAIKRITLNLASSLELRVVLDGVVQEALRLVKDARLVQIHLYQEGNLVPGTSLDAQGEQRSPGAANSWLNNILQQVTNSHAIATLGERGN